MRTLVEARHNAGEITIQLKRDRGTICYYAHPYSTWERGSNENENKLIERFIPRGTDSGKLSADAIPRVEHWMNNYLRRILAYMTAQEVYLAA